MVARSLWICIIIIIIILHLYHEALIYDVYGDEVKVMKLQLNDHDGTPIYDIYYDDDDEDMELI